VDEYSKLLSKWKGVVDKSYEKFKAGLDSSLSEAYSSLSETAGIVGDMEIEND